MVVSRIISTAIRQGRNLVKLAGFGSRDLREVDQVSTYGIDSNIPKGYKGIYSQTTNDSQQVLIGIINEDVIAAIGETRVFSESEKGSVAAYLHLKNNGDIEFNGTGDFLVRYNDLESGFNQLKDDLNSLINDFSTHLHIAPSGATGTPQTGTPPAPVIPSQSTADISESKIENFKTK